MRKLKNEPYDGLIRTNKKIYDMLTLGTSLEQTIAGNTRSYTLQYIDWKHPTNNVFHMSDEFSVERRRSNETRRPDLVLFVNGIPLVVIECKRPDLDKNGDKAVTEAITQMIAIRRTMRFQGYSSSPSCCWPSVRTTHSMQQPARQRSSGRSGQRNVPLRRMCMR